MCRKVLTEIKAVRAYGLGKLNKRKQERKLKSESLKRIGKRQRPRLKPGTDKRLRTKRYVVLR